MKRREAPVHHRWSIPLGRISGISIRVHATFFVLVAIFALGGIAPEGPGLVPALGWLVAIFACVVVHELAHSFVARRRGATVREIVLLPIGGVSRMEHLSETPADEFAIAIAGPLASIGLAFGAALVAVLIGEPLIPVDLVEGAFIARLAWLNLILGGFNLLPAFPLDGGRVFRSLLERRYDFETATRRAARTGRTLAVGMAAVGVLFNFWLVLIALFVYVGASAEEAATIIHLRLKGHVAGDVMLLDPVVLTAATNGAVAREMLRHTAQRAFPVTGPDGYIGIVDAPALAAGDPRAPIGALVAAVPAVTRHSDLEDEVVPVIRELHALAVPVVEQGRVVGLITADDLAAFVERFPRPGVTA